METIQKDEQKTEPVVENKKNTVNSDEAPANNVTKTTTAEDKVKAQKNNEEELSESKTVLEGNVTVSADETAVAPPPAKRSKAAEVADNEPENVTILRTFKRIPVFVVDYHNEVLEFIYRCLGTRHLPMENNVLIHFDSHPDMVISREIPASASFDKETMLAELSIENWIMPTCYAGHFNRVVWLKNAWCEQIPVGKYKFKIGQKDEKISVDCPLDYFISEGNYCATSELQKARDMELQVFNADDTETLKPEELLSTADAKNFILDIDLDFFSTSNPFLEIYKDANCYEQLTKIFHFENALDDCDGTTERRCHQLEALKSIFEYLEDARKFEGYEPPENVQANSISEETLSKIKHLVHSLKTNYADDEIDWLLIYDSGSTTDNKGLPHHISTAAELEQYFSNFKTFLQRLAVPPVAITIACSAEDDYCPKDQVGSIQERVLDVLREVYGDRLHNKPILYYLDEEWDVMQL